MELTRLASAGRDNSDINLLTRSKYPSKWTKYPENPPFFYAHDMSLTYLTAQIKYVRPPDEGIYHFNESVK